MKRKYDIRNKKSFIIVLILSIAIICVFSLFIYRYTSAKKIGYTLEAGSIIQDVNKNYITLDTKAILKVRWNDSYYLEYQDNTINLGKKVIVYNTITDAIGLYGNFYEIQEDGKIVKTKGETLIANTTDTKFYKIDDRKYLLIDNTITSADSSINAKGYLLVELDKLGNAKLSNNKLDLKTITKTTLLTSKYKFDINNEILNYGKYDINLKKIIGSTNEYVEEAPKNDTPPTSDSQGNGTGGNTTPGTSGGNGGNMDGSNSTQGGSSGASGGNTTADGIITGTGSSTDVDIDEIKDKTKMTSIVRILEGLNQIDFDYVIYDPYNEYKSIYAEVLKNGNIEIIHLSKNDTHLTIDKLNANTEYKINFIYTTIDSLTGEIKNNTFQEFTLKTKMPSYKISTYKISNVTNKLTYKVTLEEGYVIDKVNVSLEFNYKETDPETGTITIKKAKLNSSAQVNPTDKYILGTFDISGYDIDKKTLLKLSVDSVTTNDFTLNVNSSSTCMF